MADYQIFIVGSTYDYTPYLKTSDYNVQREDVIENWVDANRITRGHVLRTRITGSIRLVMEKATFNTFLTQWNASKNADGTVTIEVHVDNDQTSTGTVSADVFATLSTRTLYAPVGYRYEPTAMDVTIDFEEA